MAFQKLKCRKQPPEVFYENTCIRVSFWIKLQDSFIKKRLWERCFPVNFAKFLKAPFLKNTPGRMLLKSIRSDYFAVFLPVITIGVGFTKSNQVTLQRRIMLQPQTWYIWNFEYYELGKNERDFLWSTNLTYWPLDKIFNDNSKYGNKSIRSLEPNSWIFLPKQKKAGTERLERS